jgi:dihydrofolate reductase
MENLMRKIVEYTLMSVDGVSDDPQAMGFMNYRDDAYLRDGLGLLLASEAMLMGRKTYESFSRAWPGRAHPWAARITAIPKFVFSRQLKEASWGNATLVGADLAGELTRLRQSDGGIFWSLVTVSSARPSCNMAFSISWNCRFIR